MDIIKQRSKMFQQRIYNQATRTVEHMLTNLLLHSKDYIFAKLRQHFTIQYVFELANMNGDTYFEMLSIIERLDPDNFAKHEYLNVSTRRELRAGIFYLITLKKINAFIIVDTRDENYMEVTASNKVTLYFIGKGARIAEKLFLNTLNGNKKRPILETSPKSRNVKIGIVEFYLDSSKHISHTQTNESLGKDESNIFTADANKQHIFNYLDKFIHAARLFEDIGITYKTGILLYGPPGTGKTSMAKAICGKYNLPMYIIKYSLFDMGMMDLIRYWRRGKKRPFVILFDDIDCVFGKREEDRTKEEKVKSQELLEILDGANSIDNAIFIATTNDYDSLDPALVRDGRFNLKVKMDNISKDLAEEMCKNMHIAEEEIEPFLQDKDFPINPAYLQNQIIQYIFANLDSMTFDVQFPITKNSEANLESRILEMMELDL